MLNYENNNRCVNTVLCTIWKYGFIGSNICVICGISFIQTEITPEVNERNYLVGKDA